MHAKIKTLKNDINQFVVNNQQDLATFRLKFIAKKGYIAQLFDELKTLPPTQKKELGPLINDLKATAQKKLTNYTGELRPTKTQNTSTLEDFTLPHPTTLGALHPLTIIRKRIVTLLQNIGFCLAQGPEIEDDWHNFTALNFPKHHPARAMQDTFFITKDPDIVLRTHTSSVQIRVMQNQTPPIRTLSMGSVFRSDAISARSHCIFHQLEALYIDEAVSFVDLKETLFYLLQALFGEQTNIRFRPSFFPFTEPSAEVDIHCRICQGTGCPVCKHTGWVEVGGAGMVDPHVLSNCNIDPKAYTGFAFGMGLERIAMLTYRINDLRLFTENDIRFLKQFATLS